MQIALIGWQGSGKSTLFTALTGAETSIGETVHPGVANVPDRRLDELHLIFPPAKKIPARVNYLDIAGLAHSDQRSGFKRSMINHLQGSQLLVTVIGVFHLGWENPDEIVNTIITEAKEIDDELILSDLGIAENRLERVELNKKRGVKTDPQERILLEEMLAALNTETPLRDITLAGDQEKMIRSFAFLTQKQELLVVNISEDQPADDLKRLLESKLPGRRIEIINAGLEAEIARLDEEDRSDFMAEMGIDTAASDRIIQAGFEMLDLICFFTIGDDEVRAWQVPSGISAVKAAGEIHSDLERGFIRAEIAPSENFLELKTFSACRDKGLLRLEGKDYIIRDGEIMHVRFAV
ncbi:DUF933 domain-containing protein [Calditrichota bacterium]